MLENERMKAIECPISKISLVNCNRRGINYRATCKGSTRQSVSLNSQTGEVRATARLAHREVVVTFLLRGGRGSPLRNGHGGQRPRESSHLGGFGRSVEPLARGLLRHNVRGGRGLRRLLKTACGHPQKVFPGVGYGTRLIKIFRGRVPE